MNKITSSLAAIALAISTGSALAADLPSLKAPPVVIPPPPLWAGFYFGANVGGIFDADDAWDKITAGASLVQVYTGMIFQGPAINRDIVRGVALRLTQNGFTAWSQAVGSATRG